MTLWKVSDASLTCHLKDVIWFLILTNKNGQSILLANVTNNGSTETKVKLIEIVLYNKSGEKIATIPGIISPLKAGETTQLNTSVQQDYTNAYDFEIIQK